MKINCPCQICSQPIAFDATQTGQLATCPHCNCETRLFIPGQPSAHAQQKKSKAVVPMIWIWFGALLAVFAVAFLIVRSPLLAAYTSSALGAVAALAILFLLLIWIVLWIVFPVFVYFGMRRQEKLLQKIEENTRITGP